MSKVFNILTDNILKIIDKGTVPWRKPWKGVTVQPCNYEGTVYRGVNYFYHSIMTDLNGWSYPIYLTKKKIKELGGTIKLDSNGKEVQGNPLFFYKWIENEDTGNQFPIFKFWPVWNIDQCEGIPLPKFIQNMKPVVHNVIEEAQAIIDGYENAPKVNHGGDRACYNPVVDIVKCPEMGAFETPNHYYSTMFHELGHSTGHSKRLNRKEINDPIIFGSHDYSLEELVAELTAAGLGDRCGLGSDVLESSASYLAGWHSKLSSEPKMFATACARAQKAMDFILGTKPVEMVEEN